MQIDKIARQSQSEACADGLVPTILAVVETLEQVFHLFWRDAVTRVAHLDADVIVGLIGLHHERYLAVFVGVFGGIRQQIVDNLVEFVGIYPSHHAAGLTGDGELLTFLGQKGLQTFGCFVDIFHHVALGNEQFELASLRLVGL